MIHQNNYKTTVSLITGKFSGNELEQQWDIDNLTALKKEIRTTVLLAGILFFLFSIADYRLISSSSTFALLAISRIFFVFLSFLIYFKADFFLTPHLAYYSITLYEVFGTIIFFVITYNYQTPNFFIQALGLIVLILMVFFVIPNLFVFRVIISLVLSLGFLFIATLKFSVTLNQFASVAVYLTIIICLSTLSAYRLSKYQRLDYIHKKSLLALSNTDPLTSLNNRAKFNSSLSDEINSCNHFGTTFSIIMLDLDWFKNINDQYGHNTGDDVLVEIGQLLKKSVREEDVIARWGGEEFVLLLRNTKHSYAQDLAQRLRLTIAQHPFSAGCSLTCSFGITSYITGDDMRSVIDRADQALYHAKSDGRNKVVKA